MRADDERFGTFFKAIFESWDGGIDTGSVGDGTAFVLWNVVVNADEDSLVFDVDIRDR